MKQHKYFFVGAIGAIIAAVTLAGCAGAPQSSGDSNPSGAGTLTVVSIPNYKGSLPSAVTAFEKENPAIKVNLQFVDVNSMYTTIRTQLTAGTAPDVFTVFPGNGTPTAMEVLVPNGYLADLSGLALDKRIPQGMDSVTKVDGKRYVLPLSLGAIGGIYNDGALTALGVTAPKTWSEVLQLCGTAKAAGKVAYSYGAQTAWNNQLISFALTASLVHGKDKNFDKNQTAGKASFVNSAWKIALEKLLQMNTAGCFQSTPLGTSYENATALVAKGDALGMVSVSSTFAAITTAAPKDATFSFHALPATDNPEETWIPAGASGAFGINAKAKNLAAAKKFLDFLATDATMADIAKAQGTLPAITSSLYETPVSVKEILTFVAANKTHPYNDQLWPSPKVAQTLMEQVQQLIGGQTSVTAALTAMDTVYAEGSGS
ncbi:MAG: hypothetical protein B5766_11565 [Candidatus Lumbricidophila eiseniae]|uniref:Sugar ABC transporter substrate-binding protein n=1 Tax=Candidatus Lumbricidiphila eiseniae TaxID=1969409 RepID=A0A2A6FNW8_9MICO|nr:MAG: hypothetical protein B5766_11565 [Candidatus Lumbricidophila eiseniae]